jgi:hypothetical protein
MLKPPRITAADVGRTTSSRRRDRTRQSLSAYRKTFRAGGLGGLPAGVLLPFIAPESPGEPPEGPSRPAVTSNGAVKARSDDRRIALGAALPVVPCLDRTVSAPLTRKRQAPTGPWRLLRTEMGPPFPVSLVQHGGRLSRVKSQL